MAMQVCDKTRSAEGWECKVVCGVPILPVQMALHSSGSIIIVLKKLMEVHDKDIEYHLNTKHYQ